MTITTAAQPGSVELREQRRRRRALLVYFSPVVLFYLAFLVTPYLILLRMSFNRYNSLTLYTKAFTLENYWTVVTDPFYTCLLARTIGLGLVVTLVALVLGYPLALKIVRSSPRMKAVLMAVALSPLLINLVVRTYAWMVLLGDRGVINSWLIDSRRSTRGSTKWPRVSARPRPTSCAASPSRFRCPGSAPGFCSCFASASAPS